jgi:hypothetical protein
MKLAPEPFGEIAKAKHVGQIHCRAGPLPRARSPGRAVGGTNPQWRA